MLEFDPTRTIITGSRYIRDPRAPQSYYTNPTGDDPHGIPIPLMHGGRTPARLTREMTATDLQNDIVERLTSDEAIQAKNSGWLPEEIEITFGDREETEKIIQARHDGKIYPITELKPGFIPLRPEGEVLNPGQQEIKN